MRQKYFWLKLVGTVILLHIILVVLLIAEVAIYSILIRPGKEKEFYESHAVDSGPWISAIFGSLFMFLLVKWFVKRFTKQPLSYAVGLLVIYKLFDLIMILGAGYKFSEFVYPFY